MGIKSLEISLFGGLQVFLDGQAATGFESGRVRALLTYLVVERGRSHSRRQLAGLLWPDQDETTALQRLSQALYNLRQVLGEGGSTADLSGSGEHCLLVTPQEVRFNPHLPCWLDMDIFSELIQSCDSHSHSRPESCPECARRMAEAVRLVGGEFLAGFSLSNASLFEEWAAIWRERLHLQNVKALSHLVKFHTSRVELAQALEYARQLVALDPLNDPGHRQLMRLLAMSGECTAAMVVCTNFKRRLKHEMGVIPELETQALFERLKLEAESGVSVGNLPTSLSPLIGRRSQMAELTALLLDHTCRLVSLLGAGGSGKTRLALELGNALRYQFAHGVYLVSLSALSMPEGLISAIAEALGFVFSERLPRKAQLHNYLYAKQLLLILDSFETILPANSQVVELLQAAPQVQVLATTRARLDVTDEQVYILGGMEYREMDDPHQVLQSSAVQLFLAGARRARPDFILDASNAATVGRICRLVSGMPLGLLLASIWVSDHTAEEIAAKIERSLDFLSVEWADLPERQRSLRATFEYSWNLLSPGERYLLAGISVFRNSFTTQAAQQVAGARDHELRTLAGKSLLEIVAGGRYQMHDLVRQYAEEKLALSSDAKERLTRQRHSDNFLERASGWSKIFKGPEQSALLAQADKEIEDVRVAWEWAARQADLGKLAGATEGLFLYHALRYRLLEGEYACQVALEGIMDAPASGERLNLEGWLLAWQASFCQALGKVERARQLSDLGLDKLKQGEDAGLETRVGLSLLWRERGYLAVTLSEQFDYLQRSAALYQELGDPWWQAGVVSWAGEIANRLGDRALALKKHQEAVALSRKAGEPRRLAGILVLFAYDHLIHWEWETGARLMEEAAEMYQSVGDLGSQANADLHYGVSLGWIGRHCEACEKLELALIKLHQLGDRYNIVYGTLGLGVIHMHSGNYRQAAISLREALEAARQDGLRREEAFCLSQIGCLALVQGKPGKALASLQQSVASFRQMGFAGELGMALGGLSLTQHLAGQGLRAWDSFREALGISVEAHSRFTLIVLPAPLMVMLADAGKWEQAVEVFHALMTDPMVAASRWFADMVGDRMDLAREHLPAEVVQAAEARGREGDLFEVLGRLAQEITSWGVVPGQSQETVY